MDTHAFHVLVSGGPVMVALALTSLLMYKTIIGLLVFVKGVKLEEFNDESLSNHHPVHGTDTHDQQTLSAQRDIEIFDETLWRFKSLVRSRMRYSHALLVAAPLLGLLGTVMGMLDTFHGLSLQVGHETARAVADGISRALITTETGLMIAIPALFLIHWIKREVQRHELRMLEWKLQLISKLES